MTSEINKKYVEWNNDWNMGIPEIDEDHRRFIAVLNDFLQAVTDQMAPSEIMIRLQLLVDEAGKDFENEESFLKQVGYEDYDWHVETHNQLKQQIVNNLERITAHSTFDTWIDAGQKVRSLLLEHFLYEDDKFRHLLRTSPK